MQILDHNKIKQKVKRLSYQIAERNFDESSIAILGINQNGLRFAEIVQQQLSEILPDSAISLHNILLNPADPLSEEIRIDGEAESLEGKTLILVDDVANTGRTLYYALHPLMKILPKKIEVAVLVNREHKSFPIMVDYVGLSLATTLKEHIQVDLAETEDLKAFLY